LKRSAHAFCGAKGRGELPPSTSSERTMEYAERVTLTEIFAILKKKPAEHFALSPQRGEGHGTKKKKSGVLPLKQATPVELERYKPTLVQDGPRPWGHGLRECPLEETAPACQTSPRPSRAGNGFLEIRNAGPSGRSPPGQKRMVYR